MTDWIEPFERLSAAQRLGVAATAAERVRPLASATGSLDDALRLIWLQIAGRPTRKVELAHLLNIAIEAVGPDDGTAAALAARATLSVLEAGLGKPNAARDAVESALDAVRTIGSAAIEEEIAWLDWAIETATPCEPSRDLFRGPDAPVSAWTAKVSSADLPLFRSHV